MAHKLWMGIFLIFAVSSLKAQSPLSRPIHLELEEVPLRQVLDSLEVAADVSFFYLSQHLRGHQRVSLNANGIPLKQVLDTWFLEQGLGWEFAGQQIVLTPKTSPQSKGKIGGKVYDPTDQTALPYAVVYLPDQSLGDQTNLQGEFVIAQVPTGQHRLVVRMLGYRADTLMVTVQAGKMTVLDLPLSPGRIELATAIIVSDPVIQGASVSEITLSAPELRTGLSLTDDPVKSLISLPGVQAGGDLFDPTELSVRGGEPNENLYLMDNVPYPWPWYIFGKSVFNPDVIEKAEVITGAYPATYGGHLSGVFNFTTREGDLDTHRIKLGLDVFQSSFLYEGPIKKEKASVMVAGRSANFGLWTADQSQAPVLADLSYKTTWKAGENHQFSLTGLLMKDRFDFAEEDPDTGQFIPGLVGDDLLYTHSLQWQHTPSAKVYRKFSLIHSGQSLQVSAPTVLNIQQETQRVALREDLTYYPHAHGTLKAGLALDYRWVAYEELDFYEATDIANGDSSELFKQGSYHHRFGLGSAYVQYEGRVFQKCQFNTGLRASVHGLAQRPALSPRFAFQYTLNPITKIRLAGGLYHQAPILPAWAENQRKWQRALHTVVGSRFRLSNAYFIRIEGYWKQYNQLIRWNGTSNGYAQNGLGSALGVETLLRKEQGRLKGSIAYTLSQARRRRTLQDQIYPFYRGQTHIFHLNADWHPETPAFLPARYILNFRFTSGAPFTAVEGTVPGPMGPLLAYGTINDTLNPTYHNLNLKLLWQFPFGKKHPQRIDVYVEAWNLYNARNLTERKYRLNPAQPLGFEEKRNYALPFLLNFGVEWRFHPKKM